MKKCLLSFVFFLIMVIIGKGQTDRADAQTKFSSIYPQEYYKGKGIIFNENYPLDLKGKNEKVRYTPTEEDIKRAENIFIKQYDPLKKV